MKSSTMESGQSLSDPFLDFSESYDYNFFPFDAAGSDMSGTAALRQSMSMASAAVPGPIAVRENDCIDWDFQSSNEQSVGSVHLADKGPKFETSGAVHHHGPDAGCLGESSLSARPVGSDPTANTTLQPFSQATSAPPDERASQVEMPAASNRAGKRRAVEGSAVHRHFTAGPTDSDTRPGTRVQRHRAHSAIERRYRAGLQDKFQTLRDCVAQWKQDEMDSEAAEWTDDAQIKTNKASVLSDAVSCINQLREENDYLFEQLEAFVVSVKLLKERPSAA